jgi:prolyl-tRNA synthetase
MKQSQLFYKTRKETPSDADSINASYLIRAGFVEKHMAGAYAYLPLGLRVLKKVENIVREEMNEIGGQELLLNVLQPKELWMKTGRWQEMDDVLYKSGDEKNQVSFAATHEEQITTIVKNKINSYKDLPKALYQIQTKFRNEPRAKSGLLRGREFTMKDMYSFHTDDEDFEDFYKKCIDAYIKFFKRIGLEARAVEASGGVFTKKHSHEFQVFTPVGEDTIYYCEKCNFAQNKEIAKVKEGDKCPKCDDVIKSSHGIEVGNIFPLETKYSHQLEAKFLDKDGKEKEMVMGCYGIGISRTLATIVEVFYDAAKNKMVWPKIIAPYQIHLISLNKNEIAEKFYNKLLEKNIEVLYDDRDLSAGEKFAEADLIGCPVRAVISEKSISGGGVELEIDGQRTLTSETDAIKTINES